MVRRQKDDALLLPEDRTLELTVKDADGKSCSSRAASLGAWNGNGGVDSGSRCGAGLLHRSSFHAQRSAGSRQLLRRGVQEAGVPGDGEAGQLQRVLQGNSIQATIEARYFFGEPVAGAKVKYVVHTSQHYWWDEDEDDADGDEADSGESSDESDYSYGESEQQEQEGVLDAEGRLTVTLPTAIDAKHNDQDYRIEARVTDAANREVAGHATVLATYGSFRVERGADELCLLAGPDAQGKGDGAGLRRQAGADAGASGREAWRSGSRAAEWLHDPSAERYGGDQPRCRNRRGRHGAGRASAITGSGDFEITASAHTPENRTVEGKTWVWIWNGAGEWYNQNTQAQIVADKKSYQVGDVAHLLLVTGLKESWAVVTAEGNSVQSRQLIHATGESFAFDVPDHQTGAAQPGGECGHCSRRPVDDRAKISQGPAGRADA